jgi:hypothetical protein
MEDEERVLHAVALNDNKNNHHREEEDEILSTTLSTRLEEKRSAIKAWENTFVGRKPTREDVVRDERARAMYREYKALLTESEDLERRRKRFRKCAPPPKDEKNGEKNRKRGRRRRR